MADSDQISPNALDKLRLDVRSIPRAAGTMRWLQATCESPSKIGLDLLAIQPQADVHIDVSVQSVEEGLLVSGSIEARVSGMCGRCLESIAAPWSVHITELFAYPGTSSADDEDIRVIEGDYLDLEPSIIDAFGIELPANPTCDTIENRECAHENTPAPDGISGEEEKPVDPRWAGLAQFKTEND